MAIDRKISAEVEFRRSGADEVSRAEQEIRDFIRAVERGDVVLRKADASTDAWERELEELRSELRKVQQELRKTSKTAEDFDGLGKKLSGIKTLLAGLVAIDIAGALKQSISAAIDVVVEFSANLAEAGAVLEANAEGMAKLEAAARQMGATTEFSAGQAAAAEAELARAGLGLEQVTARLPQVLALAKVAKLDLANAAQLATTAAKAMGRDMSELPRILDVLTKAANSSATTLPELVSALEEAGPVAASLNLPIEETISLLGSLADAGLRGSKGGTAFKTIAISLANETPKLNAVLRDLGLTYADIDPRVHRLADTIALLATRQIDLGQASELVGREGAAGLLNLVKMAPQVVDLRRKLDEAEGALGNTEKRMSSFGTAIAAVKSALSELALTAFRESGLEKAAQDSLGAVVDLLRELAPLATETGRILATAIGTISAAVKAITGGAAVIKGAVGGVVNFVFERISDVLGLLEKIPKLPSQVKDAITTLKSVVDKGAKDTEGSFREMERAARRTREGLEDSFGLIGDAWTDGAVTARREAEEQKAALAEVDLILEGITANARRTGATAAEGLQGLGDAAKAEVERLRESLRSVGNADPEARELLRKRMEAIALTIAEAQPALAAELHRLAETLRAPVDQAAELAKRLKELGIDQTLRQIATSAAETASQAGSDVAGFSGVALAGLADLERQLESLSDVDPALLEPLRKQLAQLVEEVRATNPALAAEVAALAKVLEIPTGGIGVSRNQIRAELEGIVGDFEEAVKRLDLQAPIVQEALKALFEQDDLKLTEAERAKITALADQMVAALRTRLRELGGDLELLSPEDLEAISAQMGRVIEIVRAAGGELGEDLAKIGEQLGFDVSGLRASQAEVDAVLDEILGDVRGARELLEEEAPAWAEAVAQLGLQKINFELTPEQRERLKAGIQEIVDTARLLGEKIDPEIAAVASHLGIIIGQYEIASDAARRLGQDASESTVQLTRSVDEQGNAVLSMSNKADEAAKAIGAVGQAASTSAAGVSDAAGRIKEAADQYGEATSQVSAGSDALADQTGRAKENAASLEEAGGAAENVSDSQRSMADSTRLAAEEMSPLLQMAREFRDIMSQPVALTFDASQARAEMASVREDAAQTRAAVLSISQAAEAS